MIQRLKMLQPLKTMACLLCIKLLHLKTIVLPWPVNQIDLQQLNRGSSSPYQPSLLLSSSGKQSVTDCSSRELPPNADKVTSVASPVVNGAAKLSQSDKQISLPQTVPYSKPAAHGNGIETGSTTQTHENGIETGPTTQTSKKDAVVSNGVIPTNGCLTSCQNLQESPGQANETAMALVTSKNKNVPELSQVDNEKQICSRGSVQVVMTSSCNGSIAKKVNLKPKKFVRYPVVNMWLGSRQLLVASLKIGKKTTHKRTRRRSLVGKAMQNIACLCDTMNEQLTSTSAATPSESAERISRRQKHAHASPSHKDSRPSENWQQVAGVCSGASTGATTHSADLSKLDPSSSMDQTQSKKNVDSKLGVSRTDSIRAMDLMEAIVPCWDDIDVANTKTARTQDSKRSIGYVLDDRDEEYDRVKTKKVRRSKDDFDGPNPFQDEANYVSNKQMKQKSYRGKSWN